MRLPMPHSFGSLVFTSTVKALQERYGSRRQYERFEKSGEPQDRLSEQETELIRERDSFYLATIGSSGWPYIQHRGGPKGFLKVIDDQTLAFADFRGNKQYISAGNLATDDHIALIMVDYPSRLRLKILGHAEILEGEKAGAWLERVRVPGYKAVVERVFLIRVAAFDWNCPQHITPRYTAEEIEQALAPTVARLEELERENSELRRAAARK
jgi:predicted pyridoxine 5'-phosphate oxidase superfamily flavin-nucleotide-binding protein